MAAIVVENGRQAVVHGWPSAVGQGGPHLVAVGRVPGSHQVAKDNGQTLSASWSFRNDGGTSGSAFLQLNVVGLGTVATSQTINVSPGQTVRFSVSWTAAGLVPGANSASVRLDEIERPSPNAHIFTINAPAAPPPPPPPPPPTGAMLVALNDLRIS